MFLFFQTLHNNFNNYYNTVEHCADLRTFPTGEHYVIHVLIFIVCYIHVYTPECKKKTVFRFKSIHAGLMSNFLTNNNYGNMLGWNKIKVTDASSMQFDLKLTSNFIIHCMLCHNINYMQFSSIRIHLPWSNLPGWARFISFFFRIISLWEVT